MQAQIIVDIPLMQTDKPFSYLVPEDLQEVIAVGSRVHVPFGKSNRLLQGFVVDLVDAPGESDLKAIVEVLDLEPVLNAEQLALLTRCARRSFLTKLPS